MSDTTFVAKTTKILASWLNPVNEHIQGAFTALTDGDATPSVDGLGNLKTANTSATTITDFDDGFDGQEICVLIQDGNTTIDFTGTNLKGNVGADWTPANGDFMVCKYDGTNWYCAVHDTTV